MISSGYGSFDLPINLSFNGVDSVSRHGNRSSTAFDLECSVPLLSYFFLGLQHPIGPVPLFFVQLLGQ